MILELDCGNTRIKWRVLREEGRPPALQGCAESEADLLQQLRQVGEPTLTWCRIVSVRSDEETRELLAALTACFSVRVLQARPSVSCAGVRNGYRDFARLGLDRWLAMLGAYHLAGKACLVIDLGTAVTADLISAAGEHLGGYIAPGLPLMRAQLCTHTRRIRYEEAERVCAASELRPGQSTAEAVERGCALMVQGFARMQLAQAQEMLGGDFDTFLTGGDAALMADMLPGARVVADLVFIGLALACPITRD